MRAEEHAEAIRAVETYERFVGIAQAMDANVDVKYAVQCEIDGHLTEPHSSLAVAREVLEEIDNDPNAETDCGGGHRIVKWTEVQYKTPWEVVV